MLNVKKLLTRMLEDSGEKTDIPYVQYHKKNGIVYVSCYTAGAKTINTTYQTLGTLPAGYRPKTTFYGVAGTNSANSGVYYISDTGAIGAKTFSGTTSYFWFQTAFVAEG